MNYFKDTRVHSTIRQALYNILVEIQSCRPDSKPHKTEIKSVTPNCPRITPAKSMDRHKGCEWHPSCRFAATSFTSVFLKNERSNDLLLTLRWSPTISTERRRKGRKRGCRASLSFFFSLTPPLSTEH